MVAVFMRAGKGHNRRLTQDSASSQMPLVCHAGPELEEEVKNADVAGLTFKETESEVGMHSLLRPQVTRRPSDVQMLPRDGKLLSLYGTDVFLKNRYRMLSVVLFVGSLCPAVSPADARLPEGHDSMVAGARGLRRLGRA